MVSRERVSEKKRSIFKCWHIKTQHLAKSFDARFIFPISLALLFTFHQTDTLAFIGLTVLKTNHVSKIDIVIFH